MAAISTTTANKRLITRTLTSSVKTHGSDLATNLDEVLFDGQPPVPLTTEIFIEAIVARINRDYDVLAESDRLVATEKGQDNKKRQVRNLAVGGLRQRLMSTRSLLEGVFAADAVEALGITGRTPESPDALITFAENVRDQLKKGLDDYETILNYPRPDLDEMARAIDADIAALEAAVEALGLDTRETQQAQVDNNQANEVWSGHYSPVAALLENFYRLADMTTHADRVRPTHRRRAGLPEPADLADPADPKDASDAPLPNPSSEPAGDPA